MIDKMVEMEIVQQMGRSGIRLVCVRVRDAVDAPERHATGFRWPFPRACTCDGHVSIWCDFLMRPSQACVTPPPHLMENLPTTRRVSLLLPI